MSTNNVIWEGKPQYKPRLAILEIAGGSITPVIPLLLVLIVVQIVLGIRDNDMFSSFAYSIILALIIVGPEIHKSIRRSKTKYQLREDSITITNFWYGKTTTQTLSFAQITKLYLVNFKDDIGEIHIFVTDDAPKIISRDFYSGIKGFNVILYDIQDSAKTFDKFEKAYKANRKNIKGKY